MPLNETLLPTAFEDERSLKPSDALTYLTIREARHLQALTGNDKSGVGALLWRINPVTKNYQGISTAANRMPEKVAPIPVRFQKDYFSYFGLHAEELAVARAASLGKKTENSICTTTHCPCFECTSLLIEAGISRVVLDGAQKLRPKWYQGWLPLAQRTIDMFKKANVAFEVHDLRVNAKGNPDMCMSSEESDSPPFKRYALSKETLKLAPEEGTKRFIEKVTEFGPLPERTPDPYLLLPNRMNNNIANLNGWPLKRAAHLAQIASKKHPPHYPAHVAVLFDDKDRDFEPAVHISSPPRGCEPFSKTTHTAASWAMEPAMMMIARAARAGICTKGKSVFLSHMPTNRSALLLVASHIGKIYIDCRSLPQNLDERTADRLWKSYVILQESGIHLEWLYHASGQDIAEHIKQCCSEEVKRDIYVTESSSRAGWTNRVSSMVDLAPDNKDIAL